MIRIPQMLGDLRMWAWCLLAWSANSVLVGKVYGQQLDLAGLAQVRQSSNASVSADALKAVDANTATVAMTQDIPNSWWEAELPVPYSLQRIEVVNPSTGNSARMAGLILRIQDIRDQTVFSQVLSNPGAGATLAVDLPLGLRGRIIRIGLQDGTPNGAGDHIVALAEVRALGSPIFVSGFNGLQNGTAFQSSSLSDAYPASHALDGNNNTFTHTDNFPNSYWLLTYPASRPIQRIEVVNRADCCATRMAGLVLRILDDVGSTVATTTLTNPGTGGTFVFTPPPNTHGRALRIGLENNQTNGGGNYYVTLAEVRVFSDVVTQSTNADAQNSYPATNAVDGNTSTYSRTDNVTPNNFWQKTFGYDTPIQRVEVVARSGCCGDRLANTTLRILDANGDTVATTQLTNPNNNGTWSYTPPSGTIGRTLRIGLENGALNGAGNLIINMAEVRVIEAQAPSLFPNLALNKESYMLRLQDSQAPASNANDGSLSTQVASTTQTVDAYWEVDLGEPYAVYEVATTVPSGFTSRMNKTTLRLYDEAHSSAFSRALSSSGLVFQTLTDGPRKARYVRVGLENKTRTSSDGSVEFYIAMQEVAVFGRPLSEVGILSFGASATSIASGHAVTLDWEVEDVRELHVYPAVGSVGAQTQPDGSGSLSVSPNTSTEFILVATNGCGVTFQAISVEVDGQPLPPIITEFLASNTYSIKDGDGEASDWIEIHNPSNSPVDMAGYGLSDRPEQPFRWTMPSVVIPPHGFIVVFASGRAQPVDPAGHLHAPFALAAGGGSVVLTSPGGQTLSAFIAYPPQKTDLAYGVTLNGQTRFLEPTPRAFNHAVSYEGWLPNPVFSVERGYKQTAFTLEITSADPDATILYSTNGQEPGQTYTAPLSVPSTRSVRATLARPDYKPPRTLTHTYIFIDDVITAPTMSTSITQDSRYTQRLRDGLTEMLTLSVNIPGPIAYPEQEGAVEIIWPDSENHLHAHCGVSRFANAWTDFAKRSIRLKFRSRYGTGTLSAPLYEGYEGRFTPIVKFDELDIRSGSQDMSQRGFYMAPTFVDDTMNDMGSLNPHGRFVNLYINGQYYGMFHMRERLIDRFLADYLGGSVDDYVTVRGNDNVGSSFVIGTPDPEKRGPWERVRSLMSDFYAVKPYLDVAHLTDFMLLWFYGNSETEFRAAGSVDAGSGFKFYISDPDGFLRTTTANNTSNAGPGGIFGALVTQGHPDFKMLVADRIYQHFFNNGAMTPARMSARLTARMDEIYNALVAECARWGYRTPSNWASAEQNIQNNLFPSRTGQLLGYLKNRGLYPTFDPPAFNQHGGLVPPGFVPVLTATTGTIYYTLDGSDPRLPGGTVSPSAMVWIPGAVSVHGNSTISTRLLNGSTWSALNTVTFTNFTTVPATAANTLLSELHYRPTTSGGGEFVELFNTSTNRLDFTDVRFTEGITFTFPPGFTLDPGKFALLVETPAAFSSIYQTLGSPSYFPELIVAGTYSGRLSNDGERLVILAADNSEIAAFTFRTDTLWPARANGRGSSLELRDPLSAPTSQPQLNEILANPTSWQASTRLHGSPGRIESPTPSLRINEVLSHAFLDEDWVEIHNTSSTPLSLDGIYLSDTFVNPFRFAFPPGTTIDPDAFLSLNSNQLGFAFSELGEDVLLVQGDGSTVSHFIDSRRIPAMERDETVGTYTRSDGFVDFTELLASTRNQPNSLPRVGPIVVGEIHYHPITNAFEFITLVNISTNPVPLFDTDIPTNTWRLSSAVEYTLPTGIIMQPGGVLHLTETSPEIFRSTHGLSPEVPVFGPWSGKLDNAGEEVLLLRPGAPEESGIVPYYRVDRIAYTPASPWPMMPPLSNRSIVRQPLQAYGNDPAHWNLSPQAASPAFPPSINHPPIINFVGRTTAPAGSPLRITFSVADLDAPWQQSTLSLIQSPPNSSFDPLTGQWTWTPPNVWPLEEMIVLVATDNGWPPLAVTNQLPIHVIEPFQISTSTTSPHVLSLNIVPGHHYQIEYSNELIPLQWLPLDLIEAAPSSPLLINDQNAPFHPRRYYRAIWLDELP